MTCSSSSTATPRPDGDDSAALASRLRVRAFPTIVAFSGGAEIARHVGLTRKEKLLELLDRA